MTAHEGFPFYVLLCFSNFSFHGFVEKPCYYSSLGVFDLPLSGIRVLGKGNRGRMGVGHISDFTGQGFSFLCCLRDTWLHATVTPSATLSHPVNCAPGTSLAHSLLYTHCWNQGSFNPLGWVFFLELMSFFLSFLSYPITESSSHTRISFLPPLMWFLPNHICFGQPYTHLDSCLAFVFGFPWKFISIFFHLFPILLLSVFWEVENPENGETRLKPEVQWTSWLSHGISANGGWRKDGVVAWVSSLCKLKE